MSASTISLSHWKIISFLILLTPVSLTQLPLLPINHLLGIFHVIVINLISPVYSVRWSLSLTKCILWLSWSLISQYLPDMDWTLLEFSTDDHISCQCSFFVDLSQIKLSYRDVTVFQTGNKTVDWPTSFIVIFSQFFQYQVLINNLIFIERWRTWINMKERAYIVPPIWLKWTLGWNRFALSSLSLMQWLKASHLNININLELLLIRDKYTHSVHVFYIRKWKEITGKWWWVAVCPWWKFLLYTGSHTLL